MDVAELIGRWKQAHARAYAKIPKGLRKELDELDNAIRRAELALQGGDGSTGVESGDSPQTVECPGERPTVVPMGERRQQLLDYLRERGTARHKQMMDDLGIPNATLMKLLHGGGFVKLDSGEWTVVGNGELHNAPVEE